MSASYLRWAAGLLVRRSALGLPAPPRAFLSSRAQGAPLNGPSSTTPPLPGARNLCTEASEPPATATPPVKEKKKKHDPAQASVSSVGRKIQQRLLQLEDEQGESLGTMHRSQALLLMDERGLKLVLLDASADPPLYRLMSGKQIHQEQLRHRSQQKAKTAQVQVKELTFSSDIASHDLATKLKQVQSWLEKKNHVRLTLRSRRKASTVSLDQTLEDMVQQMPVMVGFVSKPKVTRDDRAMCILRPPSAKELSSAKEKSKVPPSPLSSGATPQGSEPEALSASPASPAVSPACNADTAKDY